MLSRRIIPCLDVRDGQVVKGVRFRDHVVMGEIVELALQASGGVRSLADIRAAREAGATAVILGRALLEGHFTLEDALAC